MTAIAQKYKESYSRFYLWFLGSGQYWVLGFLIVATMLSYRARYAATMSPFDEATYLDSILSLPDNMIAQRGEFYGDDIREKFACDGVYYFGTSGPHVEETILRLSVFRSMERIPPTLTRRSFSG